VQLFLGVAQCRNTWQYLRRLYLFFFLPVIPITASLRHGKNSKKYKEKDEFLLFLITINCCFSVVTLLSHIIILVLNYTYAIAFDSSASSLSPLSVLSCLYQSLRNFGDDESPRNEILFNVDPDTSNGKLKSRMMHLILALLLGRLMPKNKNKNNNK